MTRLSRKDFEIYLRNLVFGVEDSLVSTVGLLSGVSTTGAQALNIFATGTILIFVEAFSMGIGSFLSETSVEEFEEKKDVPIKKPLIGSLVMFFSYLLAGLIPLLPYWFDGANSVFISISLTIVSLIVLGVVSAKMFKINVLRQTLRLVVMGSLAIFVGMAIGNFFKI